MPHYPSTGGLNYMTASHQMPYSPVTTTYPSYTSPYLASSSSQASMYLPTPSLIPYSVRPPPRSATLPSQHRIFSRGSYCPSQAQPHHSSHLPLRSPMLDLSIVETEEQDSFNRDSMKSEPIEPPLQGYPKVEEFDNLMSR